MCEEKENFNPYYRDVSQLSLATLGVPQALARLWFAQVKVVCSTGHGLMEQYPCLLPRRALGRRALLSPH